MLFVFDEELGHVSHIVGSRVVWDTRRRVETTGLLRHERELGEGARKEALEPPKGEIPLK